MDADAYEIVGRKAYQHLSRGLWDADMPALAQLSHVLLSAEDHLNALAYGIEVW
jgi:hypothetical protein